MTGPKQQSLCMHSCLGILCMLVAACLILCVCVCASCFGLINPHQCEISITQNAYPQFCFPKHIPAISFGDYHPWHMLFPCLHHAATCTYDNIYTCRHAFTLHSCVGYVLYVHSSSSFNQPHGACVGAGPGR